MSELPGARPDTARQAPRPDVQAAGARRRGHESVHGIILNTFNTLERPEQVKLRRNIPMPVFNISPLPRSAATESSLLRHDRGCLK